MPTLRLPYPHSDFTGFFDTRSRPRWRSLATAASAALLTGTAPLAGCSREAPKAPEMRPVRTMIVTSEQGTDTAEFFDDVCPRIELRLDLRVSGRVVARLVDIGVTIKKSRVLVRLDPTDLALARQSAQAQLPAAKTDRDLAMAGLKRYPELLTKDLVGAAEQQCHQVNYDATQAHYEQVEAGYRNQVNQVGYATFKTDTDGVVTGVDAEAGQVVSVGQPVAYVTQTAEKEVVTGIPEDQVDTLRRSPEVSMKLWADQLCGVPAKVRETTPAANPVARAYAVKILVPNPPPELRFGMIAAAAFVRLGGGGGSGGMGVRVSTSALLQDQSRNVAWLYDTVSQTVKPVSVTVDVPRDNVLLMKSGLQPG